MVLEIALLLSNLIATGRRGKLGEGVVMIPQKTHTAESEEMVKSEQGRTKAFRRIW